MSLPRERSGYRDSSQIILIGADGSGRTVVADSSVEPLVTDRSAWCLLFFNHLKVHESTG